MSEEPLRAYLLWRGQLLLGGAAAGLRGEEQVRRTSRGCAALGGARPVLGFQLGGQGLQIVSASIGHRGSARLVLLHSAAVNPP